LQTTRTFSRKVQSYSSDFEKKLSRIPWRGILIALFLIPLNNYWLLRQEALWYARATYGVPYYNVVIILIFCTLLNGIIKKTPARKYALDPSELLVIYILLSIASSFACHQALGGLLSLMTFPFWFNTPENEFQQLIQPYLPKWLTVSDKAILAPYYKGESSFFIKEHILAWVPPLLWWTLREFCVNNGQIMKGSLILSPKSRFRWPNQSIVYSRIDSSGLPSLLLVS